MELSLGAFLAYPHPSVPFASSYIYVGILYYTLGIEYARNAPWESSVGGSNRGRLTRCLSLSYPFFALCQMRLPAQHMDKRSVDL